MVAIVYLEILKACFLCLHDEMGVILFGLYGKFFLFTSDIVIILFISS